MTRRYISTLVILYLVASASLRAQDASAETGTTPARPSRAPLYVGVSAGVFFGLHSGGFSWPYACQDCGVYDDGSGVGTALDLRVSIPVAGWLRLEPRLFGECHRATFTSAPINTVIIGKDLAPQQAQLEDELEYTLRLIGFDLMAAVPLGRSGISLLAGPAIGFRITETATVTERIVTPDGAVFLDGSREHKAMDGDAERARSMHAGIRAGAAYTLPIGPDLALGVEASWLLPLQTVTEDDEWRTTGARLLVSLLFVM